MTHCISLPVLLVIRAAELDEKNASYHFLLGKAYYETRQLEVAEKCFTRAISFNNRDPEYFSQRGSCRYDMGSKTKVKKGLLWEQAKASINLVLYREGLLCIAHYLRVDSRT